MTQSSVLAIKHEIRRLEQLLGYERLTIVDAVTYRTEAIERVRKHEATIAETEFALFQLKDDLALVDTEAMVASARGIVGILPQIFGDPA